MVTKGIVAIGIKIVGEIEMLECWNIGILSISLFVNSCFIRYSLV